MGTNTITRSFRSLAVGSIGPLLLVLLSSMSRIGGRLAPSPWAPGGSTWSPLWLDTGSWGWSPVPWWLYNILCPHGRRLPWSIRARGSSGLQFRYAPSRWSYSGRGEARYGHLLLGNPAPEASSCLRVGPSIRSWGSFGGPLWIRPSLGFWVGPPFGPASPSSSFVASP